MTKLEDYFRTDENPNFRVGGSTEITVTSSGRKIPVQVWQDFSAGAIYFAFYIDAGEATFEVCRALLRDRQLFTDLVEAAPKFTLQVPTFGNVPARADTLFFAGRVYLYSETTVSPEELNVLVADATETGLFIQFFGPDWRLKRESTEKPLAFISHDSRDKKVVATPLAEALRRRMIPVWFSDYSLRVGDSLRESIEHGLRECRRCVLILTPNYLANPGWTKAEFNAVFTRELIESTRVVLPVWAGVSQREVFEYSPWLADRVALMWETGIDEVSNRLAAEIRKLD